MITGKIYANGYWEGLEAIFLKDDLDNPGWVYVLAMELPDSDMSPHHAICGKTMYCHAQTKTTVPTIEELAITQAFVYIEN